VHFTRYKAFLDFSVALDQFNILVGPNNAGKSTVLGAFRILFEALRRAKARSSELVEGPNGMTRGHRVNLDKIPIATENVFYNYDDETAAEVSFRLSTGEHLILYFPEPGECNLVWDAPGRAIVTPSAFKSRFEIVIGMVPVLGPVEHDEQLFQREAAREALLTHRASRNFRNIWHHYPESFDEFRLLIQETWPGMDIERPEVDTTHEKTLLRMFCPEERIPRELYWSGFGFQVWCQMLTFMVMNREASLFIIDEPDIYLHSDLQRQLVTILRTLGPDILLATHSTEIVTEADPNEILVVTKTARSAKRIKDPAQLQSIFSVLGSNLNPTLTQIARSKRVVFVEGKDFQLLGRFASRLGFRDVATRSHFAVVPTQGFNPTRARMFVEGMEATLSSRVAAAVIFDRDYRCEDEIANDVGELQTFTNYAHILSKKELENYLLVPDALGRAVSTRIEDRNRRTGGLESFSEDVEDRLTLITDAMRLDVQAQYLERRRPYAKAADTSLDETTITRNLLEEFDEAWGTLLGRLAIVPGGEVFARFNSYIQDTYRVTVTSHQIVAAMDDSDVPEELKVIIARLDAFSHSSDPRPGSGIAEAAEADPEIQGPAATPVAATS
jgi:hypothetical protein